ncbi:unnamed protein product [Bursaphelenchus okinawaensis]|uniref:DNA mismatch repair proteins mutS family domain-containing protein n=1 Tax=Bursaphelenchus okinawaensis TaxID=465554 RepID=A0A811K522_9BILA|nr:unnamed protein product [Bursaphelenchus okinawaensis]CAG9091502.1 unnamed protein product [Bursaphelenchus okinawaensis]
MKLEEAALTALEIFDTTTNGTANGGQSLYEYLNECRTSLGKRLLRDWLLNPSDDYDEITRRHDVVEILFDDVEAREQLYNNYLRQYPDVCAVSKKLEQNSANLEDVYKIYRALRMISPVVECFGNYSDNESVIKLVSEPLLVLKDKLSGLEEQIEKNVEQDPISQVYRIKPESDDRLRQLNDQLDKINNRAEKIANSLSEDIESDAVKVECNPTDGYCMKVTLKDEKDIRSANVTILDTKKNGITFINNRMEALNKEFLDAIKEYEQAQTDLTVDIMNNTAGSTAELAELTEVFAVIDVLVAFAVVSITAGTPFVRPEMLEMGSNIFELRQCRHPVVEKMLMTSSFIPNDIVFTENKKFMVLTGANMGGKSTYLRSAATTVLFAHIGCFVPCESARLSVCDGIFTRVGAGDCQFKAVSTFMSEMTDSATILDNATSNSFIIIDELGRGTTTYDGFGLAWAIAEDIVTRLDSFCIFATHFHEMAHLSVQYPDKVLNLKADVAEEDGQIVLLYQFSPGVTERSFGITIAKMVNFPEDVIQEAENTLQQLEKSDEEKEAKKLLLSLGNMNVEQIRFTLSNLND